MSKATELLDGLTDLDAIDDAEPHIVIGRDRFIEVPAQLRRIGVQHDHNVETVTFDCPRYWDEHDLSALKIYVNYMRSDGYKDSYYVGEVTVDETDSEIIHFKWKITKNVTLVKGLLSFLICAKEADADGNEETHWNSELNRQLTVSEGLECAETILANYPDIITQLLTRMETVEEVASPEAIQAMFNNVITIVTQEEYDALVEAGTVNENVLYLIRLEE